MVNIRKINPMFRAIGTMGVVAGLVGAVTFANLTSNTVALSPNDLTTANASLVIDSNSNCSVDSGTTTSGLHDLSMAPGDSTSVNFCIMNTGDVPLNLSATIPQASSLAVDTAAQNITFGVSCTGTSSGLLGSPTTTLSSWSPEPFGGASLAAGETANCTASATLAHSYSESNHQVPSFSVVFSGTQP